MIRRLFWVGVGVGLTVLVIRKGRDWYTAVVPEPAVGAVDTAVQVSKGLRHALDEFRAGRDAKETELTAALIGDRDIDELRAAAPGHRAALRSRFEGRDAQRTAARIAEDWSDQPTEDPDEGDYAF